MNHGNQAAHLFGMVLVALLAMQFVSAPARADDKDMLKAVAGIAALAVIAQEARRKRERREAAAESARNAVEQQINRNQICRSGRWAGNSWVENSDGRPCLPTPKVCLRERWREEFLVKYFDPDCMKQEGFRLSRKY